MRSLALCREKTIRMKRFADCSAESRTFVFYDLLVNLLRGDTPRKAEVVEWPEFAQLPQDEQARLLRLIVSKSLQDGEQGKFVAGWLRKARELNPKDKIGALLNAIYTFHPSLCRLLVQLKTSLIPEKETVQPFADLFEK
jgi:hypothetical protein